MKTQSALFLWPLVLFSCADRSEENQIFASACATKNSSGEIVECKTGGTESSDLHQFLLFSIELDKTHPGPSALPDSEHLTVKSITWDANIILDDGIKLALAGLECNAQELGEYLSAIFLKNEPSKLTYQLTGDRAGDLQYAYIWEVTEIDFSEAEGLLEPEIGLGLSPINETAITSQWCVPVKQPKHQYHERYAKIARQIK